MKQGRRRNQERMKLTERITHTWVLYNETYLKAVFDSVSYCVVILRKTPHWSVRMAACNFSLKESGSRWIMRPDELSSLHVYRYRHCTGRHEVPRRSCFIISRNNK